MRGRRCPLFLLSHSDATRGGETHGDCARMDRVQFLLCRPCPLRLLANSRPALKTPRCCAPEKKANPGTPLQPPGTRAKARAASRLVYLARIVLPSPSTFLSGFHVSTFHPE